MTPRKELQMLRGQQGESPRTELEQLRAKQQPSALPTKAMPQPAVSTGVQVQPQMPAEMGMTMQAGVSKPYVSPTDKLKSLLGGLVTGGTMGLMDYRKDYPEITDPTYHGVGEFAGAFAPISAAMRVTTAPMKFIGKPLVRRIAADVAGGALYGGATEAAKAVSGEKPSLKGVGLMAAGFGAFGLTLGGLGKVGRRIAGMMRQKKYANAKKLYEQVRVALPERELPEFPKPKEPPMIKGVKGGRVVRAEEKPTIPTKLAKYKKEGAVKAGVEKAPKVETAKQAVQEIIEGKRESRIGTKEFKERMLAELDKIKATKVGRYERTTESKVISIPGDGEFGIDVGADIYAIKTRVRRLSEKPISRTDWTKGYRKITQRKTIKEHIKAGEVEFVPVGKKPAPVEPGAFGTQRGKTAPGISKRLEPSAGKPVGIPRIKDYLSKSLKVPIRIGHIQAPRQIAGIYKRRPEVARVRDAKNLATIAHEVAHHIDKKYTLKPLRQRNKELVKLDYGYPKKRRTSEGFAEYVRIWLTGAEDVNKLAPNFAKSFNKFLTEQPELKTVLDNARSLITQWREQGAIERVYGQIDISGRAFRPSLRERIERGYRRTKELFVDDLAQLEYAEEQMRGVKTLAEQARIGKLPPAESPTLIARATAKRANSIARSMILDGTFDFSGKQTGISLKKALAPVHRDMKNWLSYAYAKRAMDLSRRGINAGIELGDAQYIVSKLESPTFKKALGDVVGFQDRLMQYAVDAGVLSKEAAKVIRATNPIYIPLKRSFESGNWPTGGGKKMADLAQPIKRIKGSGRPIRNPLHSIIENTAQIINVSDKVRVGRELVNLAEKTHGAGKWVERIPPPQRAVKIDLKRLEPQLKEAGIDLSQANMEQVLTFFSNAPKYIGRDNIVSFWRGGRRQFYEVHPDLYRTLNALDAIQLKWYLKVLGAPARGVRLGATGLRAGFALITNPWRDAFGFGLQTEFSRWYTTPYVVLKGLYRRLRPNDPMNLLYKQSGADMAQFLGIDRRHLKMAVDEVLGSDVKIKSLNVVRHPIEVMKQVLSVGEAAPRVAEFEAAFKKGRKLYGKEGASARVLASTAAADVTVNFGRMGVIGSSMNQVIPFFNAGVQGVSRFYRYMAAHPVKGAIKATATLTVPTIALWHINKDRQWYKELPAWQKYGFWNMEIGTNKDGSPLIVRLPRPFEWGVVFSSAPEAVLNYWYAKDPEALKEGIGVMADQINPLDIPTFMRVPVELWANYDFFRDRPIDPFFEVEYKEPEDRFSPYTTTTAKFIGRTFGMSPRKIEHLAGATTGGLAMDIIRSAEGAYAPSKMKTPADYPVVGRVFGRTWTPEKRKQILKYMQIKEKTQLRKLKKAGKKEKAEEKRQSWNRRHPDFKIPKYF